MKLVHIGVPTQVVQPGEHYVAPSKMYMTNPDAHPFRFEFLRIAFVRKDGVLLELMEEK